MTNLTPVIRHHLDNMRSGDKLEVAKSKDPDNLIAATKAYIDEGHPEIEFNADYTVIKKLHQWPTTTP